MAEVDAWFARMAGKLVAHPIIDEFLGIVSTTSPFGLAGRALQPLVVEAAIGLVPADLARRLSLRTKPSRRTVAGPVLGVLAQAARRAPGEIPRQAFARMGRAVPKVL